MNKHRVWRAGLIALSIAGAAGYIPAAWADAPSSNEDLADLVKQQARQIKKLNERLDRMERSGQPDRASKQQAAPSSSSRQKARGDAQQASGSNRQKRPDASQTTTPAQDQSTEKLEKRVADLEEDKIDVDWSEGAPEFSTPDGKRSFKLGGRLLYDFSSTFGSSYGDRNITGTQLRQVRLKAEGKLAEPVGYMIQADFNGGSATLNNAFLSFKHDFGLGTGVLFLGNKLTDRGMDARTPLINSWFTERGAVANTIPGADFFSLGATAEFYGNDNWHSSLGVYKGSAGKTARKHSSDLAVTTRTHWNPIENDDGLLHLGVSGTYERFHNRDNSFSENTMLGSHYNGNVRVNSDEVEDPRDSFSYALEMAGILGPFAMGGEWGQRFARSHTQKDMEMSAYNVQAGYSLTGEQFGYSGKLGVWAPPEVENPVFEGGWGAWQLIARYQGVSFQNNRHYKGGSGHGTSVGVDWYLNNMVRAIMEYTRWHTNNNGNPRFKDHVEFPGGDGGNSVNARLQMTF